MILFRVRFISKMIDFRFSGLNSSVADANDWDATMFSEV